LNDNVSEYLVDRVTHTPNMDWGKRAIDGKRRFFFENEILPKVVAEGVVVKAIGIIEGLLRELRIGFRRKQERSKNEPAY
jgi:hypothetical protein